MGMRRELVLPGKRRREDRDERADHIVGFLGVLMRDEELARLVDHPPDMAFIAFIAMWTRVEIGVRAWKR
jgi:hypothetical protein